MTLICDSTLLNSRSFLVVIDNKDISRHESLAGRTGIAGAYTYPDVPNGLLITEDNVMQDYLVRGYDGDQATLEVVHGVRRQPIHIESRLGETRILSRTALPNINLVPQQAKIIDLYSTRKPAA